MRRGDGIQRGGAVLWVVGFALMIVVIGLSVNPTPANDLFWQLRAGRDICASGHPLRVDTYSWTRTGAPLVMHEWLMFVLLWKAYAWSGGFAGVWLLQTLLLMAVFGLLFRFLLRETEGATLTAFVLSIAAAVAATPFFQPRPHLFTYLFLVITLGALLRVTRQPKRWRLLLGLPPLFALWANLHAGVLVGIAVLVLWTLGEIAEVGIAATGKRKRRWAHQRRAVRLLLVTILCVAATLINPYGWHLYHNFVATIGNKAAMDAVIEWASPNFHEPSGKLLEGIAILIVCGLAFTQRRRHISSLLITVALAHAALTMFRNVPLFAIVGILLAGRHIQSALSRLLPRSGQETLFGSAPPARILSAAAITMAIVFLLPAVKRVQQAPQTGGAGLERVAQVAIARYWFPENACRFLEAQNLPANSRIYNDYDIGGYLIWRLPHQPVFIDGRADVYFERVLDDYLKVHKLAYQWREVLDRYRPDVAILSAQSKQTRLFLAASEWKLVYADAGAFGEKPEGQAVVFVRRLPQYASLPDCRPQP